MQKAEGDTQGEVRKWEFHMKRSFEVSKPNLSFIILLAFLASFVVARVFTSFFPSITLLIKGYHIHHFWFGLAFLTIGGWLGINYREDHIERIAAIIFGVGGGLVGDEIGLLITFGDYYSELTYTFVISLLVFAFMATLIKRHGQAVASEFLGFLRANRSLYLGLFMAFLSLAFLIQSDNLIVISSSTLTFVFALILIITWIARHLRTFRKLF